MRWAEKAIAQNTPQSNLKGAGNQTAFWNAGRNLESRSTLEHLMALGSGPAGKREGRSKKRAEDSGDN